MNSLKRQACKAERYAKLRDEMRAKLRVVLASKFAQLERRAAALEAQISAHVGEEIGEQSEAVQQLEAEHSERTQRGYAMEREGRGKSREAELAQAGDLTAPAPAPAQRRTLRGTGCALGQERRRKWPTQEQLTALCSRSWKPIAQMLESAAPMWRGAARAAAAASRRLPGGGGVC